MHLDDIELLLIFLRGVADTIGKLCSLLRVKLLVITTLCTLSFTNLIYLLLESLFLGLCQSDLVTEFMLDDTNCMLVVKVIIRDLIVTGL